MDLETSPPQPDDVSARIADALAEELPAPDAWWRAGIEENLGE
jgi:hypothetical protein